MNSPSGRMRSIGHQSSLSDNEHMANILSMLWPEPCTIGSSRSSDVSAANIAYAAIPSWTSPAVIAPRRPRRLMAASLRGYNTAATGRSRAKAQLSALAASTGAADLIFPTIWIDDTAADGESSIRKYLTEVLGQEVTLSISVGPDRAVQKPVIQIIGTDGRRLAFAKVGQNALTRDLVEREARNLRHLASTLDPGCGVQVPTVLTAEVWRDTYVLVQSVLARGHAPARDHFIAAMRTISRLDGIRHCALHTSSYWNALQERVRRLPTTESATTLRSAIAAVGDRQPSVTMPFGSWHGDMTPWNITASHDGVRIWDWEHYGVDVPVGFDVLHYEIQNRIRNERMTPTDAVHATLQSAPGTLALLDVPSPAAPWTALLYLVEMATRYVQDGEQDGDTAFGQVEWLEPNLRQQLAAVSGAAW